MLRAARKTISKRYVICTSTSTAMDRWHWKPSRIQGSCHGQTMCLKHHRQNIKLFGRWKTLPKIRQRLFNVQWYRSSEAIPPPLILPAYCDYQTSQIESTKQNTS